MRVGNYGGSGWNGGWRGGCWNCGWRGGWWGAGWWGGVAVAAPWWGWGWGWGPGWGWNSPTVVVSTTNPVWWGQDPVFVEQPQPQAPAFAPSAPANPPPVTWFYCTQPAGYFPYVQSCSRPWVRVVPDAMQPPPSSWQPQQG